MGKVGFGRGGKGLSWAAVPSAAGGLGQGPAGGAAAGGSGALFLNPIVFPGPRETKHRVEP